MAWRDCLKIYRFDAVIASSPNGGKTTPHQHLHFDEVVAPPRRLGVVANSPHLSDQNMLRRPHNRRTAVELHSRGGVSRSRRHNKDTDLDLHFTA